MPAKESSPARAVAALPLPPFGKLPAERERFRELLGAQGLLRGLGWNELGTLAGYFEGYRVPAGHVLLREGEPGDLLCLLLEGRIEVRKSDGQGRDKVIVTLGAGKTIGEMSLIDGERHSASCVAVDESLVAVLMREHLERLQQATPRLAIEVLWRVARILSQRLRQTSGRLVDYL